MGKRHGRNTWENYLKVHESVLRKYSSHFVNPNISYKIEKITENYFTLEIARLEVGRTKTGLQIWCVRHDMNVVDIDLSSDNVLMTMPLKCQICSGPDCEHVT